ncbi:MAG: hypothetical protein IPO88_12405 [Nannocystis sp.]|nr:hypothetical protein [Nannocystis sp.]
MTASEGSSGGATDGATSTPTSEPGTTGDAGTTTDTPASTSGVTTDESTTDSPTTDDPTGGLQECDPVAQDCPPGLKCTAYGKLPGDEWNANKCVPEPQGGGQTGDPCAIEGDDMFTGIDNCAVGNICLNVDAEQKNGACIEFCSPEMTCPNTSGGDGICIVTNDGALPICLAICDPLLQDCAGQGACYGDPAGPPFICFNPDPKNGGMDGDACDFTNACLKGLNCAQADTQEGCMTAEFGCCAPFCALDEMTCTGGEECLPFFMEVQPGFENLGICALPG